MCLIHFYNSSKLSAANSDDRQTSRTNSQENCKIINVSKPPYLPAAQFPSLANPLSPTQFLRIPTILLGTFEKSQSISGEGGEIGEKIFRDWKSSGDVNGEKLTVIKSPTMARKTEERRRKRREGNSGSNSNDPSKLPGDSWRTIRWNSRRIVFRLWEKRSWPKHVRTRIVWEIATMQQYLYPRDRRRWKGRVNRGEGGGETFRQIFAKNVAHTLATRVEKSLEFSIFLLRTFGIVAGRMIQLHLRFATR